MRPATNPSPGLNPSPLAQPFDYYTQTAGAYSTYSRYHPDNLQRVGDYSLPEPVKGPAAPAKIEEVDMKTKGAWGHRLCCERPYGPNETTTRIKDNVTTKVGSSWNKTITVERGTSTMCSAMYGGSLVERSFSALANAGVGSLKR